MVRARILAQLISLLFFFQERVHWIEKPKWCPSGILCWTIFTSCKHQHHIVSSKGCPSGAHFDHRMTPSTSYSSPCSSQESTRTIFILWFYFVLRLEVSSSVELWMKLFLEKIVITLVCYFQAFSSEKNIKFACRRAKQFINRKCWDITTKFGKIINWAIIWKIDEKITLWVTTLDVDTSFYGTFRKDVPLGPYIGDQRGRGTKGGHTYIHTYIHGFFAKDFLFPNNFPRKKK